VTLEQQIQRDDTFVVAAFFGAAALFAGAAVVVEVAAVFGLAVADFFGAIAFFVATVFFGAADFFGAEVFLIGLAAAGFFYSTKLTRSTTTQMFILQREGKSIRELRVSSLLQAPSLPISNFQNVLWLS